MPPAPPPDPPRAEAPHTEMPGTAPARIVATGFWQRLMARILPPAGLSQLESQSRRWIATCPAGHAHDLWSLGGIRAGARGTKRSLMLCPDCGRRRLMRIAPEPPPPPPAT